MATSKLNLKEYRAACAAWLERREELDLERAEAAAAAKAVKEAKQ